MYKESSIKSGLRELPKHINVKTIGSGTVAAIFGCTGPSLIIIDGASNGGLTYSQSISWLFSIYFISGLMGILISLKYRLPIAGAYSIAGAVLVSGSLAHFTLNEAIGAYIISNLLILIFGFSGLIEKMMNWIPVPIVMGMIAGVMISFATDMIISVQVSPLIAGAAILSYVISSRFIKAMPPVLFALVISIVISVITREFSFQNVEAALAFPQIEIPTFNIGAIISISLPLFLLVICTENAQAIGILMAQKFKPPINTMAIWSAIAGFCASIFGGHAINAAGPMTAICASEESGDKAGRYSAAVVNGILFVIFGLLASLFVPFVIAMPIVVTSSIAGLAMIGVLLNALKIAFSDSQFQIGAFFALIIGMSEVNFFNISSPFWAIVGSLLISLVVEREHFVKKKAGERPKAS